MTFLYIDIETDDSEGYGLDPFRSKVVTFQILFPSGRYALLKDPKPGDLDSIKSALENNIIVGDNIRFEAKFLKHHFGITLKHVYDIQIAEQVISGGQLAGYKKGKSLKDLVFKYCRVHLDKELQRTFKIGKPLTEDQIDYAISDIKYLPEILKQQQAKIKLLNLENVIELEMKAIPAFAWLELSGIYLDLNKLKEIKEKTLAEKEEARRFLLGELISYEKQQTLYNKPISTIPDLDSPSELLAALQARSYKLKNTSDVELSRYPSDPIIQALKKYRKTTKRLTSFIKAYPKFINPVTGRIHSNFNQYGAFSGRLTSEKPNMQQQPKTNDWRMVFAASPGYKIISADYSQIELRILGQVSHDKEFIRAYNEGIDLHQLTASKLHIERNKAKPVNFGIAYGMWTKGLIDNLRKAGIEITEKEAKDIINGFYRAYSGVSKYLWNVSEAGLRNLEVRTLTGRLMKFDPPKDDREKGNIKRESKNLPIQGLCADMLKIVLGNLFLVLEPKGIKFINTVHDEIVFECKAEEAEEVAGIIKDEMEKTGNLFLKDLPCETKITVADYWMKE